MKVKAVLLLILAICIGRCVLTNNAFARSPGMAPRESTVTHSPQNIRSTAGEWSPFTDVNRDGVISRQEADRSMPHLSRHFNEIDVNRDGVVTREEVRLFREKRIQQRLERERDRDDPRF